MAVRPTRAPVERIPRDSGGRDFALGGVYGSSAEVRLGEFPSQHIDSLALTRDGETVYWTEGGVAKSAALQ